MINKLFQDVEFSILNSPDFKEDSVREEIILPILKELGYSAFGENKIVRSKSLAHPFVKIGSTKRKINIIPDYLLLVQDNYKWVLDAKAPNEKIRSSHHVEPVYSYAIHPDIRVKLYALCNGREFIVFKIDESEPLLHFPIPEINRFWSKLVGLLSPQAFNKIETTEIVQSLFTQLDAQRTEFIERETLYQEQIEKLTETVNVLSQATAPTKKIYVALQQLGQGNVQVAKMLLTEILEEKTAQARAANHEAAEAARYLGALAFYTNHEEALTAYRQAVELDPENPEGWTQLGLLLEEIDDLEGAQAAYEKAFKLGGSNA